MARCVLEEVSQTVVFTRGLNEWRALCRIMYSLSVCSDGTTSAAPRSFRQNRPPARTLSSTYSPVGRNRRIPDHANMLVHCQKVAKGFGKA